LHFAYRISYFTYAPNGRGGATDLRGHCRTQQVSVVVRRTTEYVQNGHTE